MGPRGGGGLTICALTCAVVVAWLPAAARADLTTFGYGNARLGTSPAGAGVAASKVHLLRVAWRAKLDGAINDQPLVLDGLKRDGRRENVAFVATEHGALVAVDTARGSVLWRRKLSTRKLVPDCGAAPDGRFGVTGTMVIDRRAGRIYAVDVDGLAWALDVTSGRVARGWPVRVHPKGDEFVWGALALSRGRLYVSIASLCDSGHYFGGVTAVDVSHPKRIVRYETTRGTPASAGAIWGWGGISIDSRSGDVYGATGNSLGTLNEDAGDAESVVRLSASLRRLEAHRPLVSPFVISDRDFGTTPVLVNAHGCPPLLVAINKVGAMYVYDRDHVAAGPTQTLAVAADSYAGVPLYGMPVYDPLTRTLVLVSPSTPAGSPLRAGVQAFTLGGNCQFATKWQQSFDAPDAGSAPTISDGVVYIGTGRNGWLRAYRLTDGARLWGAYLGSGTTFAAPAVDGGTVYAGTWGGQLIALRPRR
jgi:outer membrane protein assembly factor BamB